MIEFNSNTIIGGYIKQILKSFNLPVAKVYKPGMNIYENITYIKDDELVQLSNGEFKKIANYIYNLDLSSTGKGNYTKNLKIDSLNYDTHTHIYLGDYLRFQRDYNHLNLMSLYNCYSNEILSSLNAVIKEKVGEEEKVVLDLKDNFYKIVAVPVKFDEIYTVALDCAVPYDIFCGYYSDKLFNTEDNIMSTTLQKVNGSSFNKPFVYSKLRDEVGYTRLVQDEPNLKMFIRIPSTNKSTITVLEGNYVNSNNILIYSSEENDKNIPEPARTKYADMILNYKCEENDINLNDLPVYNKNQLLYLNSGTSYPFADRLVEYLSLNAITNKEEIINNIKEVESKIEKYKKRKGKDTFHISTKGVWEDRYKGILYDIAKENGKTNTEFDILGYVDKDVENILNVE